MAKTRRKPKNKTPRKVWVMRVNSAGIPCVDSGDFVDQVKVSKYFTKTFIRDVRGSVMAVVNSEIFPSEIAACEAAIGVLQDQIDAITEQQNYYRQRLAEAISKGGA